MQKLLATVIVATALTGAFAQTRSSFLTVDAIQDVTVTVSNGGKTFKVDVGAAPTMTYNGIEYDITDVFGFWALSNDDDLDADHSDIGVWRAHENNAGGGGIAGWKTNPNTGLRPNQSFTFDFNSLTYDRVEQFGFHIRLDGQFPGTDGNTGYATVPEPASMLGLALGLATLARRRRK